MKKSHVARKILKKLQEWEGSRMEMKTANEIVDLVVELGMLPPCIHADDKIKCKAGHNCRYWEETK